MTYESLQSVAGLGGVMASRPCDSQPPELLKRHSGVTLDWRRPGPETARAAAAAVATALGSAICGACSTQLLPADFSAQSALSGLAAVRRILSRSWPTPPITAQRQRLSQATMYLKSQAARRAQCTKLDWAKCYSKVSKIQRQMLRFLSLQRRRRMSDFRSTNEERRITNSVCNGLNLRTSKRRGEHDN